jgi:cyclase
MLSKRVIACLDVSEGVVVKGTQFKAHVEVGDPVELAQRYRDDGVDELVFYEITASSDGYRVPKKWVEKVAKVLDIPFCVAGGIQSVFDAREILAAGADKVSINSPALKNPDLISELANEFGRQCVVVSVDSRASGADYYVYELTGRESTLRPAQKKTLDWLEQVQAFGAGEIVLNCMDHDGMGSGFDIQQLQLARHRVRVPLVASGGARTAEDFEEVFRAAGVDAALGASAFHSGRLKIQELKKSLLQRGLEVRL